MSDIVTDRDREKALQVLFPVAGAGYELADLRDMNGPTRRQVERVAEALADERERVFTMFERVADHWEGKSDTRWQQWRRAFARDYGGTAYAKVIRNLTKEMSDPSGARENTVGWGD